MHIHKNDVLVFLKVIPLQNLTTKYLRFSHVNLHQCDVWKRNNDRVLMALTDKMYPDNFNLETH